MENLENNRAGLIDVDPEQIKKYYTVLSQNFASMNKRIISDMNQRSRISSFPAFYKDDITSFLANPQANEKKLRQAINYIYAASPHFRRLIQYFVGLSDLSYIVEPYRIDPNKINEKTFYNNYRKTLKMISSMNIKTEFTKILTVCLREDVFYGTFWVSDNNITIQQLPSDYCSISSIEENVLNVSFDFSYFDMYKGFLDNYPDEFKKKYKLYKDGKLPRWIELDSPNSFAVKATDDVLTHPIPPFAGILREIYDIEDYKKLKKSKKELENYAMLAMKLPMDDDGSWAIDYKKAVEFWFNLDSVLPEEVGSVLTPMDIDKIDFDKSHVNEASSISEAEQNMFTAAGVSSLLFNNEKASSNALLLSIKADQSLTYGIVKNIGIVVNRLLHKQTYGKNFQINMLDVSPYNRKEVGDAYLKAASYGLPTISAYVATQGIGQEELDSMSFLETKILKLQELFQPIRSSNQMSSDEMESTTGAPSKSLEEMSDSTEANQEGL